MCHQMPKPLVPLSLTTQTGYQWMTPLVTYLRVKSTVTSSRNARCLLLLPGRYLDYLSVLAV